MDTCSGRATVPTVDPGGNAGPVKPSRSPRHENGWTLSGAAPVASRRALAAAALVELGGIPLSAAKEASAEGPLGRLLRRLSASVVQAFAQGARRSVLGATPQAPEPGAPLKAPPLEIKADAPVRSSRRVVTIDEHWRITEITGEAAEWIGAPASVLLGIDVREAMSMPQAAVDAVNFSLTTGRSSEVQIPAPSRPGRWMDVHLEPLGGAVKLRFWDITEFRLRKLRAQADAETGRTDLPLADAGSTELALLDENGLIVSANEAWRAAFARLTVDGHAAGVGAAYLDVCRQVMVDLDEAPLSEALKDLAYGDAVGFTKAYRVRTAAGLRWREVRITPMGIAGSAYLVAIHTDLTEVARAQAALRRSEEQVIRAQQEERQRIAIELHDSTSQHLIALGLGITRLRRLVGAPRALAVLEEMAASVKEAVKEVRVLSYLMKPASIDDEGLEAVARAFVTGFGARTGLNVSFRAEGRVDRASSAVRHAAFRIIQEALANVHRHAGAKGVEVELSSRAGVLSVRVADDGHGIPALRSGKLAPSEIGVGVASMQERVAKLGGWFEISSDEAGAVVSARLPVTATATVRMGLGRRTGRRG